MKVLIACEESQEVCKAFRARGHEAYSCDLQDCSGGHPEWHLKMDALEAIKLKQWDLMIGHPPCTYLAHAGNRWLTRPGRIELQKEALNFFIALYHSPIEKIALENPRGHVSRLFKKESQVIQPYHFGHAERKYTCLWLKNLPPLMSTLIVPDGMKPTKYIIRKTGNRAGGRYGYYFHQKAGNAKNRSKTFPGIAKAMAEQWG